MDQAKAFLQRLLERADLKEVHPETSIYTLWGESLQATGLALLAKNSAVIGLERRILFVRVKHPVFLQELRFHEAVWKPELERRIAELPTESKLASQQPLQKVIYRLGDPDGKTAAEQ